MKRREFEKIAKQLLPLLPGGFAVDEHMLFMVPVGHTLCGITYEDSSEPKDFYADVFLEPLFMPESVGLNVGWRLGGNWCTWNIDSPTVVEDFRAVVEREALPFLLSVKTPEDVALAALALKKRGDPVVRQAIFFACCRAGGVEQARMALDQFINPLLDPPNHYWEKEIERARALMKQLETNPADAHRQMDAWEVESARNLKLEKYR